MIQISGTWIDPASKAHDAILANDEIKPITGRIRAAHELLATAAQPVDTPRLNTIIEQEARIDARHDAIIRGIWGFLTAKAELIGGDAGNAFISLRDLLLPDGLQSQLKTYRGEAGQALQLADRMTPAVRAQTDGILIGQGPNAQTLTYYVDELIDLGKQLGTFENERAVLEAGAAGFVPKTGAADVLERACRTVCAGGVYVPPHALQLTVTPSGSTSKSATTIA